MNNNAAFPNGGDTNVHSRGSSHVDFICAERNIEAGRAAVLKVLGQTIQNSTKSVVHDHVPATKRFALDQSFLNEKEKERGRMVRGWTEGSETIIKFNADERNTMSDVHFCGEGIIGSAHHKLRQVLLEAAEKHYPFERRKQNQLANGLTRSLTEHVKQSRTIQRGGIKIGGYTITKTVSGRI